MTPRHVIPFAALALALASAAPRGVEPRFKTSDPLAREAGLVDAAGVRPTEASLDRLRLAAAFHRSSGAACEAADVNSIGEVPDGNWFVNRIGAAPMRLTNQFPSGTSPIELTSAASHAAPDDRWNAAASRRRSRLASVGRTPAASTRPASRASGSDVLNRGSTPRGAALARARASAANGMTCRGVMLDLLEVVAVDVVTPRLVHERHQ